jgi:CelD/BcsL family acetyltransferase involved in cellulose biosynthesis
MNTLALAESPHRAPTRPVVKLVASRRVLFAEVLRGADAYAELQHDWHRLAGLQNGAILFQAKETLTAWANHFAPRRAGRTATIVVRHEKRAILIWPLLIERRMLATVATGAGAPIGQYDEFLLDPEYDAETAMKVAIEALVETARPDFLFLERVRADGSLRRALGNTPPLFWAEGAPFADLSGGIEPFIASLKQRVARQQKKRVQRFRKAGRVAFEMASNPAEAETWLADAMAIKRKWLRSTGRISRAFVKQETGDCLADLARALSRPDASPRMIVARLTLDGRPAAIEMGFCQHGAYHLYLGAFEHDLAKFGPGNILTEHMLRWCAENGIHRYDMLAPRSRNKAEWQSGEVSVLDFALPMTLRGRLYVELFLKRLKPALKQLFYALPAPLRSLFAAMSLRI